MCNYGKSGGKNVRGKTRGILHCHDGTRESSRWPIIKMRKRILPVESGTREARVPGLQHKIRAHWREIELRCASENRVSSFGQVCTARRLPSIENPRLYGEFSEKRSASKSTGPPRTRFLKTRGVYNSSQSRKKKQERRT